MPSSSWQALLAVALLIYLFVSLIKPEWFG